MFQIFSAWNREAQEQPTWVCVWPCHCRLHPVENITSLLWDGFLTYEMGLITILTSQGQRSVNWASSRQVYSEQHLAKRKHVPSVCYYYRFHSRDSRVRMQSVWSWPAQPPLAVGQRSGAQATAPGRLHSRLGCSRARTGHRTSDSRFFTATGLLVFKVTFVFETSFLNIIPGLCPTRATLGEEQAVALTNQSRHTCSASKRNFWENCGFQSTALDFNPEQTGTPQWWPAM